MKALGLLHTRVPAQKPIQGVYGMLARGAAPTQLGIPEISFYNKIFVMSSQKVYKFSKMKF
jgi:hypothetical protein